MANQVVTLVFTDVVGSSAAKRAATLGADISERDRAYLEGIQAKYLKLVRAAVAEHHGNEVMTIGDSFFLTFDDPHDALRCCSAIQQQLEVKPISTVRGPLRLRIGIHVGRPEYFENSWHGTDVDIAARVQSVASPEQIILTNAARERMGDPLGITLRPLGTFTLKGVGDMKLWDADYNAHGPRPAAIRSSIQEHRVRLMATTVVALGVTFLLLFGARTIWPQTRQIPAAIFPEKPAAAVDSIIVADFDNKTGEPVFDTTITQAFSIQLSQSPIFAIVGAEHLRQSKQFIGKSADDPLAPGIAREIAMREGIKAYLTGSISKLGDAYLVIVNAIKTQSGDTIASEQAQAANKDHVLEALGSVATAMRTHLGESLESIQKLDTPVVQATTPSLEAFRCFALGDVEHQKGNDLPNAERLYRQALDLDPNFALVWARLGAVYWNSFQVGKSADCYDHAFRLMKNVSERERFYIESQYDGAVSGDLQKMIGTLELACQTYPLDSNFFTLLGNAKGLIGQPEAVLVEFKKALELAPDSSITASDYCATLMALDRLPEAMSIAARMKGMNETGIFAVMAFYNLDVLTGDTAGMASVIASCHGRVDEYQLTGTVAYSQEFMGQYRAANDSWERAAAQAGSRKATDNQAASLLARLSGRALAGFAGDAGPDLKAAMALDQTKPTQILVASTAALCNQSSIARPLMSQLASTYPNDTLVNQVVLPQCRGALALAAHHPQEALKELEGTEAYDRVCLGPYLEGLAYLELHDGPHAVNAFQRATLYRGVTIMNNLQDYGQAQLGLARAFSTTGDKDNAKKSYEALFATWKDADADLPQLVAAKREYAALQ